MANDIDAIIFDMDGTLVNSIPVYLAAYEKVLDEELGLDLPERVIKKQFGRSSHDIMMGIFSEMRIDPKNIDVDAVLADVRKEFWENAQDIVVIPGSFEILDKLDGNYPLGLATSSRRYYSSRILKNLGLDKYFDVVVTADDVARAKPAPDLFLKSAELLEKKPAKCLVFEDAVPGVHAAKAAGMKVVAVTTGSSSREELLPEKPLAIIDCLKDFDFGILK